MLFLSLNNVNTDFLEVEKFISRNFTAAETLPTTCWVELINKKKFNKVALNENSETFMIYVIALEVGIAIHPS